MLRSLTGLTVIVVAAASAVAQDGAAPAKEKLAPKLEVRVIAIQAMKPRADQRSDRWYGWHNPGTSIAFHVKVDRGRIVSYDLEKSRLNALTDDLGTPLTVPAKVSLLRKLRGKAARQGRWLSNWSWRPEDGFAFVIGGPSVPAEGAMAVSVQATVVLNHVSGEKTAKAKDVKLKDGAKMDLGLMKAELVGVDVRGDNRVRFGLRWTESGEDVRNRIKEFILTDKDGTQIWRGGFGGSYSMSSNGAKQTVTKRFYLNKKLDKIAIELSYYDNLRKLHVPIDVTTGVGF